MRMMSLEKSSHIKLIVLENKKVAVRQYEVSFSLLTRASEDLKEMELLQLEQNISFAKVMCFIDLILNGSILITVDSIPYYEKTLCEFSNNYVLLPNLEDNTIISVLLAKFNSIIGDNTEVNAVTLLDQDDQLKYRLEVFDDEEEDSDLPNIKDWLGDLALNDEPWWSRADESTWDGVAKTKDEYDTVKTNAAEEEQDSIFDDIEESIKTLYKTVHQSQDPNADADVIEVDFQKENKKKKWKPKLV
jgi:hypothetical protein